MELYQLIRNYQRYHPNGHYFDRDTLKWFGERLSEMRVLKTLARITDIMGETHDCYVVSSIQRPPYGRPQRKYAYFDVNNYNHIIN